MSKRSFALSILVSSGLLAALVACSRRSSSLADGAQGAATAGDGGAQPFPSLTGEPPMIVAHRGLPGLHPEETVVSYNAAADVGADALEEDLHLSKDCVLVLRHNAWLSDNTNIAAVAKTNPAIMDRKRTRPGVNKSDTRLTAGPTEYPVNDPAAPRWSLVVDGEDHVNDWAISDFTAEELGTLVMGTTFDARDERPTDENGKYPVLTFQQVIDIAKAKGKEQGRQILVYPETKNPSFNNEQALANGCPGERPLEDALLKILADNDLNTKDAPVIVQSFEPGSLKYLRDHGLKTKAIQLIGAADVDFKTGEPVYNDITNSRPYDWTLAGDSRWFGDMLTPDGLREIKTYADGIGPWKPQIVPLKISPWPDSDGDGGPYVGKTSLATTQPANSVIRDAHAAGLFVHPYTFRNEKKYLAADYGGDPTEEYLKFFRLGVDGVFTDFANVGVEVKKTFLEELGR